MRICTSTNRALIVMLLLLAGSSLFGCQFNVLDFYNAPFKDATVSIPPVYTDKLEDIMGKLRGLKSIEDKPVENPYFKTINPGKRYTCEDYYAEYVRDSRGVYFRENLVIELGKELKHGIKKNMRFEQLAGILKEQEIYEAIQGIYRVVSVSYEDLHIWFYFEDDRLLRIRFLRGD